MLRSFGFITACLLADSLAGPSHHDGRPTVQIRNGTVLGHSTSGIDGFFGIPYAKPPVSELRLRAPQTIDESFGRLFLPDSIDKVAACTQMTLSPLNLSDTTSIPVKDQAAYYGVNGNSPITLEHEDCLTLNIFRPAGVPSAKKLPVLFWVYGGGWEIGTTQTYNALPIVNLSMSMNEPIIFVAANYRVNAFGFLQGKQLQAEGGTNIGLRDQRKAMEWVAENIAAFGGNPDQVTIWGESAGAASVWDHVSINNGDNNYNGKPLFHGAIMNSGVVLPTQSAVSQKAQAVFDSVTKYAGCPTGSYALDCLRKVSYETFKKAMNKLPDFSGADSNNLAYIHRPDPSSDFYSQFGADAAETGRYARVPVIMGNQQDEATIFTPAQKGFINDTDSLVDYFATWYTQAPRKVIEGLVTTYNATLSHGLPTDTGSLYEIYPQSKRNAAMQTDLTFVMGRRIVLQHIASQIPAWSYLATYLQGDPWWGTYHTSDLGTQYSLAENIFAGTKMDEAYIHFVNYHNPNGKSGKQRWPRYDSENRQMANFSKSTVGVTTDDYRWESFEYWSKHQSVLRQ